VPSGWDLASDGAVELESVRDRDADTLLRFDKRLATRTGPGIKVVIFEPLSFRFRDLNGFQIVNQFNLLVADFFLGIIATEKLRFCDAKLSAPLIITEGFSVPMRHTPAWLRMSF
jgi:hypothetical protein